MIGPLVKFLSERKERFIKKIRTNIVRERTGYSEYTWWMTTVSFDEVETVDFEALMLQIAEFEESFKKKKEENV